jgi:hypothetical protein
MGAVRLREGIKEKEDENGDEVVGIGKQSKNVGNTIGLLWRRCYIEGDCKRIKQLEY